jgi:hypothetical protein
MCAVLGSAERRAVGVRRARAELGILAVAGVVMAAVVAGIGLLTGGQDSMLAKPSPRGGLVAVPDKPAALNRPPLVKTWPAPKVVPPASTVPWGRLCPPVWSEPPDR